MLMNTKALILGVTGGYGRAMAIELGRRGVQLRALVRDRAKAERVLLDAGLDAELIEGDILYRDRLSSAAAGCDVVVHGINAPYHKWNPFVVRAAAAVADVAVEQQATILFPGNVYAYAPGVELSEDSAQDPPTDKGALRVQVEARLREATHHGAHLIILRAGDFFGFGTDSTWASFMLGKAAKGSAIVFPGPLDVRHQWAFLPDVARAHVELYARRTELAPTSVFHFAGHVVTGAQWVDAARSALGDPSRTVKRPPWALMRLVGLFAPMVREVVKMRYLWEDEVVMSGRRLESLLGEEEQTDLIEALRCELVALGSADQGSQGAAMVRARRPTRAGAAVQISK